MCAGAIVNARVKRLVFGCTNPKAGAVATLFQIVTDPRLNHRVEVAAECSPSECAAELSQFFAELRRGPTYQALVLEECPSGLWCLIRNQMCESTGGSNPSSSATFHDQLPSRSMEG